MLSIFQRFDINKLIDFLPQNALIDAAQDLVNTTSSPAKLVHAECWKLCKAIQSVDFRLALANFVCSYHQKISEQTVGVPSEAETEDI